MARQRRSSLALQRSLQASLKRRSQALSCLSIYRNTRLLYQRNLLLYLRNLLVQYRASLLYLRARPVSRIPRSR